MKGEMDLYQYIGHVTRLVLKATMPERSHPVPVCILGVLDTEWGGLEANRETFDESVMCPKGVQRRVSQALLYRCTCGRFHGVVPKWVEKTLRDRPGPGLRLPPRS